MTEEQDRQKRRRALWRQFVSHSCMAEFLAECEAKVARMEKLHEGKKYDEAKDLYIEAEGARKMLAFIKGKLSNTTQ